jgi:hypothetical protein
MRRYDFYPFILGVGIFVCIIMCINNNDCWKLLLFLPFVLGCLHGFIKQRKDKEN